MICKLSRISPFEMNHIPPHVASNAHLPIDDLMDCMKTN